MPGILGALVANSRASVRTATARAVAELLNRCGATIPRCVPFWLDCLLTLSQDAWPLVTTAANEALDSINLKDDESQGVAEDAALFGRAFREHLLVHVEAFGAACKRGESAVLSEARLLAGSIHLIGPAKTSNYLCTSPMARVSLCAHLTGAFSMSNIGRSREPRDAIEVDIELNSVHCDASELPRRHAQLAVLTSQEVSSVILRSLS